MARIRPETGFETTLSSGVTASQTSIGITTAPTETSGYMVIEPGTSNKEIIKYTGVTGTTLTGVTRGIALTGSSDAAGTGKTHAAGSTVSMTNVHYYMEQLVNRTEANTWTAEQTFETANINIGDGTTDENEQITANNGDASKPFIRYSAADNKWLISNNGSDTYDPQAGGSGVTAGAGIDINAGAVTVDPTDPIVGLRDVQVAGETINGATLPVPVYMNNTDDEWYACDANVQTKLDFRGFAVTNGTDGAAITIQFSGVVTGFTGLTVGAKYYVQDAVGTIGTTVGTYEVLVGIAISATELLIQKGSFEYMGSEAISGSTGSATSTSDTVTMPANAKFAIMDIYGSTSTGSYSTVCQLTISRTGGITARQRDWLDLDDYIDIGASISGDTITITVDISGLAAGTVTVSGTAYFYS